MTELLGPHDELLRIVEGAFPVSIHVRGNEISITGPSEEAERVGRLFEELVLVLESGQSIDRDGVTRSIDMLRAEVRPSEVLSTEVVRGRKTIRPKTAGQKRYVDAVREHTITFAIGPAGTGKSYLAVALAVQALQAKDVNRIILTRPAVEAGEHLGFLPGDMLAKVDPYLRPLYDALYDMLDAEAVARLIDRGTIEVAPLAYIRGRTLNDSFIILDEAQNTTAEQMKMFLTRLGFGRVPSSRVTSPRSTCLMGGAAVGSSRCARCSPTCPVSRSWSWVATTWCDTRSSRTSSMPTLPTTARMGAAAERNRGGLLGAGVPDLRP